MRAQDIWRTKIKTFVLGKNMKYTYCDTAKLYDVYKHDIYFCMLCTDGNVVFVESAGQNKMKR